jgi:anti-sigma factor RsiW
MNTATSCLAREQIFYFAQGMLKARQAEMVRRHLAGCAECRESLEGYKKLNRALDSWTVRGPSAHFDLGLQAAIASAADHRRGFFGLPWGRWLAPASLAAMVVFGMVMVHSWRQPARYTHAVLPRPVQSAASRARVLPATPLAAQSTQAKPVDDEMTLYKNLPVLENFDMLANFDVLSELAKPDAKSAD